MMNRDERLVFEKSVSGRVGYSLPKNDVPEVLINAVFPKEMLRDTMAVLPEVSEVDVIRHYTKLSQRNYGVDSGFYPLGSCTMKYNPKINEDIAAMDGFCQMHPLQNPISAQGSLEILYKTDRYLSEILGMEKATLQPAAGAQGEMTGLMIIKAYHMSRKDEKRVKIIVPDSSHGTNPASAALAGFEVTHIPSNERGCIDIDALKELMDDTVAGLMLTNPNTLGLFEKDILQISEMVHNCGGLLYYDGANMNAIMGIARPGDMGFDIAHVNLHKTFSTPHGGGGPGSGPIAVVKELVPFLPSPVIEKEDDYYVLDYDRPLSIGKVKSFYGNFAVILKAYCYIRIMGAEGLKEASTAAVLNANYVRKSLEDYYDIPQNRVCMHEFVLSAKRQAENGITALDIAKNLLDKGYHPPTIYFPMIVSEAMMIEPTETESPETLDAFIEAMIDIAKRAEVNPETLVNAPKTTYVSRLDEVKAARTPVLRWK